MMNAEQVRAMAPQWLKDGRNMVPAPYRNHPEILKYMANNNNSVFNYESINQQARAALNGNIHNASSAVTPATTSTSTVNYSAINAEANAALNRSIGNASSAVTPATTSTVTRAAVVPNLTPEAQKALQMAEDASKPFSTSATQINQNLGIGTVDREADLLRRKLAVQESGGRSAFRDISREWTGRSKALAEQADDAAKAVDKVDDVAKGFNWKKAGKIGAIVLGAAALIGGAAWLINKLCKKDEAPVDKTPVEETPATTEPETPETPEAPVAPIEPEVPVVPVEPTEPEAPVAPTEPTEPEVPATPELPTEYEAQRGDGIWHIAERYLKDKYANEPDKFENLTTAEKNKKILDETLRIAELNNYELVERTINGKKQNVPNPTLHPGDKVKVQ